MQTFIVSFNGSMCRFVGRQALNHF